jgi:hypothetical protein
MSRRKDDVLIRYGGNAPETKEQQALYNWASMVPVLKDFIFAIPNGGSRSGPREGARFKAEGVRPGVPDLMIAYPARGYHGLFIELKKRKGGRLTPAQNDWLTKLEDVGYFTKCCYGWDEARELIEWYMFDRRV